MKFEGKRNKVELSFILIIILMVLRYPILFVGETGMIPAEISYIIYLCATYLISAIFIYQYRGELEQYNIRRSSVLIFIFAPLLAIMAGNDYDPTLWVRLVMSMVLAVLLFSKRKDIKKGERQPVSHIMINIALTVAFCIGIPILAHLLQGAPKIDLSGVPPEEAYYDIKENLFFQLSSAAISEEPLFRGFLWGYLKQKGIRNILICLLQAGLFWVGHIYYVDTGINFWLIHPLIAVLIGLLVWKTKSITNSMIAHSCINTFSDYLRFIP